jgi:hypothetical protein
MSDLVLSRHRPTLWDEFGHDRTSSDMSAEIRVAGARRRGVIAGPSQIAEPLPVAPCETACQLFEFSLCVRGQFLFLLRGSDESSRRRSQAGGVASSRG